MINEIVNIEGDNVLTSVILDKYDLTYKDLDTAFGDDEPPITLEEIEELCMMKQQMILESRKNKFLRKRRGNSMGDESS